MRKIQQTKIVVTFIHYNKKQKKDNNSTWAKIEITLDNFGDFRIGFSTTTAGGICVNKDRKRIRNTNGIR